jgi:hypothetical protein
MNVYEKYNIKIEILENAICLKQIIQKNFHEFEI